MGLAGLRLGLTKTLFLAAALFISAAVLVHVTSRLPHSRTLTAAAVRLPHACLSSVSFPDPTSFSLSGSGASCRPRAISRGAALDLLSGGWIVTAGDSQLRLVALSLLSLLIGDDPDVRAALFRRHSDYQIQIPDSDIRVDFLWAPFEPNVSSSLRSLTRQRRRRPNVVVAGSGLWHMLHVGDAADYGLGLAEIRRVSEEAGFRHSFWAGLPALVPDMLNTEEKRARMNATAKARYEREIEKAGILRRDGGTFELLDVGLLSEMCGRRCTTDGMHYDKVVYDALVQVMLNALMIVSRPRV